MKPKIEQGTKGRERQRKITFLIGLTFFVFYFISLFIVPHHSSLPSLFCLSGVILGGYMIWIGL